MSGTHSIYIQKNGTTKNTYDDFHLLPKNRPLIAMGEAKTTYTDVPGMNGSIDYTQALGSGILHGKATGTWSFILLNDNPSEWAIRKREIETFFDGSVVTFWLEDDITNGTPTNTAIGRIYVSDYESPSDGLSEFELTYTLVESDTRYK